MSDQTETAPPPKPDRRHVAEQFFSDLVIYARRCRQCIWIAGALGALVVFTFWFCLEKSDVVTFEFSYSLLGPLALFTAGMLVPLLIRLLASVENVSEKAEVSISDENWRPPNASDLSYERGKILYYLLPGAFIAGLLVFLFASTHTSWDTVDIGKYVVAASLGLSGLGAEVVFRVIKRELMRRKEQLDSAGSSAWSAWSRPSIAVITGAFAITGIIFALYSGKIATVALNRSARANVATSRGQLYQAEARLTEREATQLDLQSLYKRPKVSAKLADIDGQPPAFWRARAKEYWNARLELTFEPLKRELVEILLSNPLLAQEAGFQRISSDTPPPAAEVAAAVKLVEDRIAALIATRCQSADALYEFIFPEAKEDPAMDSFIERRCRASLNQMSSHLVDIFDLIHAAFDYKEEQILRRHEFDTWVGYLTDAGAHPMLIVTAMNWLDQGYLSPEFLAELNARFTYDPKRSQDDEKLVSYYVQSIVWEKYFRTDLGGEYAKKAGLLRSYRTKLFQMWIDRPTAKSP
jgi:hypothetical protein